MRVCYLCKSSSSESQSWVLRVLAARSIVWYVAWAEGGCLQSGRVMRCHVRFHDCCKVLWVRQPRVGKEEMVK